MKLPSFILTFSLPLSLRTIWAVALMVCCAFVAQAQREKNNIYLFDCTGSMKTNKLWEPAKTSLDETVKLNATIPGSRVTIIPFGDEPYQVFSFDAKDYTGKKNEIYEEFEKRIQQAKFTHISDVLAEGWKYIDNNKDNRIYLLTDGQPNHNDSPARVAETIAKWCGKYKNARFFYVALTKSALDGTIRKALESCPDAFIVEIEGNVIPQFADLYPADIYTNLEELNKPRKIEFSLPGSYDVRAVANDSLFEVKVDGNRASDGKILVTLSPKFPLEDLHQKIHGTPYEFPVSFAITDKKYHIVNPEVRVHVSDEIPSKLNLAEGNDELVASGVKWHDSFLWSPAKEDQRISWDLTPVFENQLQNSSLNLKFSVPEGDSKDLDAWYNEKPLKSGDVITIQPGQPALLSIQFHHDAKTGKRYFELTPVSHSGIDLINDQPAEEYEGTTLRSSYSVGWNPLAVVLFWIAVAIVAFLVIWFLFLQRVFYPRIKMGKVEFTGPDTYYQSKKLKGARKVVLTSKKKTQNIFSRIFTGEIRYVKAPHFLPELEITPASGKKKVKVSNVGKTSSHGWDVFPSSIFKQYDKGELKNRTNNDKTTIEFS